MEARDERRSGLHEAQLAGDFANTILYFYKRRSERA